MSMAPEPFAITQRTSISFGPAIVEHGQDMTLATFSRFPFRPAFLVVDPDCASFFDISSLVIGIERVVDTAMAATLFLLLPSRVQLSEAERRMLDATQLDFPTCQTGTSMALKVKHRASCEWHLDCLENTKLGRECSNRPFRAALYGVALRS